MHIIDLDCRLIYKIFKFADDTKLGSSSNSEKNYEIIERDLDTYLNEAINGWKNLTTVCVK